LPAPFKQVSPASSPRGRQAEREKEDDSSAIPPKDRDLRSRAPARTLQKDSVVKSDRDLYNDLLEEATLTQHTCSTSNSSLEFDGNGSSRFSSIDLDIPEVAAISPGKALTNKNKVIVDSHEQSRPRSPGHTGHERRQKFTFVGEMLDDNDDDADGADEFGEEEGVVGVDFTGAKAPSPSPSSSSTLDLAKPKAVRHAGKAKSVAAPNKPKKKTSAVRCDAV
jgi:hypothetical protein